MPYAWTLFYCPMHFLTHEILLFATGVWTTNIHDCIHGAVWPVLGAGYHTIHHTTYKHNYGHYFIFMVRGGGGGAGGARGRERGPAQRVREQQQA